MSQFSPSPKLSNLPQLLPQVNSHLNKNYLFERNFQDEVENKNKKNKNFDSLKNKKLFSTSCSQGNLGNSNLLTNYPCNRKEHFVKHEEDYLFLLLSAAENLVDKGLTSYEEMLSVSTPLIDDDLVKYCDNTICHASGPKKSKIWVKVKNKNNVMILCTTCADAWNNKQFCFYCNVIYTDNASTSSYYDTKNWVMCDYCEMWQHIQCEEIQGYYQNFPKLLEDSLFKYMCPLCRRKEDLVNNNSNNSIIESPPFLINNSKYKTKRDYKQKRNFKNYNHFNNKTNSASYFLKRKLKNENLEFEKSKKLFLLSFPSKKEKTSKYQYFTNAEVFQRVFFIKYFLFNLDSVDSREIYHDFYKITNLNENKKT